MSRFRSGTVLLLVALPVLTACANHRSFHNAQAADARGDWEAAMGYYRQALAREPDRLELRIQLERVTRLAAAGHMSRARELEAGEQWSGALAAYRAAAELDPSATLAQSKATEIERRLREMVEAARGQPKIHSLRAEAQQASPIPRLNPETRVRAMRFEKAEIRDIVTTIAGLTRVSIQYDQGLDSVLAREFTVSLQEMSLEDALNQVLSMNQLTFKVLNPETVFIYQDTPANRQRYEDVYGRVFYVSNADVQELFQMLTQMTQTATNRPVIFANKGASTLTVRATAPIMDVIATLIRANDKPKAEVIVEAEILEVDRTFIRQLGLDLSQYGFGLTFSPELGPSNTAGTFPPANPPPFNLNTLSGGIRTSDFYVTSPTALIRLLESNTTTRVLAKPQVRGRDSVQMTLTLGDLVPIPQTTFQAAGGGGATIIPATQVTYQSVGVNLIFTPRVTYDDEILLEGLTVEKSGLGNFLTIGGQQFPTIVSRRANTALRLRDGESTLIAGLLRDDERKTLRGVPGIMRIPLLRALFGTDTQADQTDLIMMITPRILRSHQVTPDDLRDMFMGTADPITPTTAPATGANPPAAEGGEPPTSSPASAAGPEPADNSLPDARLPQPGLPGAAAGPVRLVLSSSSAMPGGALEAGSGPHTIPITISGAPQLTGLTITITYDPAVIVSPCVVEGTFMRQGGAAVTFAPVVDAAAGRVDIAVSRPGGPTTTGSGLLASITFTAGKPGTTDLVLSATASSATGPLTVELAPARVVVRE